MAIPKYYEMYKPFLLCLKEGLPVSIKDVREYIAKEMGITSEERKELLPSGKQPIFDNRVGWTKTYLDKAGLIKSQSRGVYLITDEGLRVLSENPNVIDDNFLSRYPSFREFIYPEINSDTTSNAQISDETPQDVIDKAFLQINKNLADELLLEIMRQTPEFFERLVVRLLEKMGYGGSLQNAGLVTGQTGDEGIDGIIWEDKLGFELIYIQAKRWDIDKSIGRPEIQRFVGALAGQGATKGLFVTTAKFSKEAREYAKRQLTTKVILVDGLKLAELMIEYNLGVTTVSTYEIKKIDTDFFADQE